MRSTTPILTLVVIASLWRPAHAGGGGLVIPPMEISVGAGTPVGEAVALAGPSTEVLAGVHWASLSWKPTWFDIGIGYAGSFRRLDHQPDAELRIHGGYLQLASTIAEGRHWRTWLATRGELMRATAFERMFSVLGGAVRLASEVYASGSAGAHNGLVVGTIAVGIYVEASYRDLPSELGNVGLNAGVSARLPFLLAGS